MDNTDRIHIALSPWDLTDIYNRHVGVTLLSILEHCNKPVIAHLLYDERRCVGKEKETAYNKQCYQKIADKYDCILEHHHVEIPDWVTKNPNVQRWTPGALERLHLAELLPSVDKILYFDCDMVINTSVDSLWETDLGETFLGACLDTDIPFFSKKRKRTYTRLKIPISNHFCSGVLLLNLAKLREDSGPFSQTIYQFLAANPNLPYPDQDMLNWYCQGNYTKLPEKYNVYVWDADYDNCTDIVLHYANNTKPWLANHGKIDLYYWNYALRTPWLDTIVAQIDAINSALDIVKILEYAQNHDFLRRICGTKIEKAKIIIKFIWSIIISCFKSLMSKRS